MNVVGIGEKYSEVSVYYEAGEMHTTLAGCKVSDIGSWVILFFTACLCLIAFGRRRGYKVASK